MARQAAALAAVDPRGIGGIWLHAGAGPVRDAWLNDFQSLLPPDVRLLRCPVHATTDRLIGGLDLARTLAVGAPVAEDGLLARAHGQGLLIAGAERLDRGQVSAIIRAFDDGVVRVDRDGISQVAPSRFFLLCVDESDATDGSASERANAAGLSPALAERLGMVIDLRSIAPLDVVDPTQDWAVAPGSAGEERRDPERAELAAAVRRARRGTEIASGAEAGAGAGQVHVGDAELEAMCATALAFGAPQLRHVLQSLAIARANARLEGRAGVGADDLAVALRLCVLPRATQWPAVESPQEAESTQNSEAEDDTPSDPPPTDSQNELGGDSAPPDEAEPDEAKPDAAEPERDDTAEPPSPEELMEVLIAAVQADVPAGLLDEVAARAQAQTRTPPAAASAGAGQRMRGAVHGRSVGARPGQPRGGQRLHLLETLRAAAPWQRVRREGSESPHRSQAPGDRRRLLIRQQDFRIRRIAAQAGTLAIFVVDASGSTAFRRLAEAKGAVELLLADCYVRRDSAALVAARGRRGEVILEPTRSLTRAKRALGGLVGGGGTPLASALEVAHGLAAAAVARGTTPLLVVLTDGRANIDVEGRARRAKAGADAQAAAARIRGQGMAALVIDTAPRPEPRAEAIALAMGARYLALPLADAAGLKRAVESALPTGS